LAKIIFFITLKIFTLKSNNIARKNNILVEIFINKPTIFTFANLKTKSPTTSGKGMQRSMSDQNRRTRAGKGRSSFDARKGRNPADKVQRGLREQKPIEVSFFGKITHYPLFLLFITQKSHSILYFFFSLLKNHTLSFISSFSPKRTLQSLFLFPPQQPYSINNYLQSQKVPYRFSPPTKCSHTESLRSGLF
jgi:hypothetical protein